MSSRATESGSFFSLTALRAAATSLAAWGEPGWTGRLKPIAMAPLESEDAIDPLGVEWIANVFPRLAAAKIQVWLLLSDAFDSSRSTRYSAESSTHLYSTRAFVSLIST